MSLTENHTIAELLYENGKLSAELEAERFMLELITSLSSTELIDDGSITYYAKSVSIHAQTVPMYLKLMKIIQQPIHMNGVKNG